VISCAGEDELCCLQPRRTTEKAQRVANDALCFDDDDEEEAQDESSSEFDSSDDGFSDSDCEDEDEDGENGVRHVAVNQHLNNHHVLGFSFASLPKLCALTDLDYTLNSPRAALLPTDEEDCEPLELEPLAAAPR